MPADTPITHLNHTATLKQWGEVLCIPYSVLKMRHRRGDKPPELFRPLHTHQNNERTIAHASITHHGITQSLKHWAQDLNIAYPVLKMRYTRGDRGSRLLRPAGNYIQPEGNHPLNIYIHHRGTTKTLYAWSRIYGIGYDTVLKRFNDGETDPAILFHNPMNPDVLNTLVNGINDITNTTTTT